MNNNATVKALPVNLLVEGRLCLLVGGGRVALRKCHNLLSAGAKVRVVSPALCPGLAALVARRKLERLARPFKASDIKDAVLVFACTDKRDVNRQVLAVCRLAGVLCSCADGNWAQSDFTSPAVARHGGLTLAISTGGQSCRRAKLVKESLARHIAGIATADLVVAGTDHRCMHLDQREHFHPDRRRMDRIGAMLMQVWGVHEFMLLNTCNRIEIMAVASRPAIDGGILCHALGFDRLDKRCYYQLAGPAAWEHAALVCAGMMSQTPGEHHVAAQMKAALAYALRKEWAAGMLQEWIASALHLSKHIKNDVAPGLPALEIEDLAMQALQERCRGLENKTILVAGSGMLGRGMTARALRSGARVVWCYHRNKPDLPPQWRGRVEMRTFMALKRKLMTVDAVVCAAEASGFLLGADLGPCFDPGRDVILIDLGVPRNIDPALADRGLAGRIIDMQQLKDAYGRRPAEMKKHIDRCRKIVHAHRDQYERLMESFQGGNA